MPCLCDLSKWVRPSDSCCSVLPDCVILSHGYLAEGSSSRNQKQKLCRWIPFVDFLWYWQATEKDLRWLIRGLLFSCSCVFSFSFELFRQRLCSELRCCFFSHHWENVTLLCLETTWTEREEQDPLPYPGLGPRLSQRAQVQSRPGHLSDHESGR